MGALNSDVDIFIKRYSFAIIKKFITDRSEIFKYVETRIVLYKQLSRNSIFYGVTEPEIEAIRSTMNLDYDTIFKIVKEARNHLVENHIAGYKMIPLIVRKLLKNETDIALKGKYYDANKYEVHDLKEVSKDLAFYLYAVRISGRHYGSSFNFDECFKELTTTLDPLEILLEVGYLRSLAIIQNHDSELVKWQKKVFEWKLKSQDLPRNSNNRFKRHIDDIRNDPNFWSTPADAAFKNKNIEGNVVK